MVALIISASHLRTYVYTAVQPAYRQLEGIRIAQAVEDFQQMTGSDFVIRFEAGDEAAALMVLDIARASGDQVLGFFNHHKERPVEIIVFPDEHRLKGALRIPTAHSAMGAYAGGKIHILSPQGFTGGTGSADVLQNVFVHELAHLVVDDLTKGNYPMMFTEGVALYLEYEVLGYEWGSDLMGAHGFTAEDLMSQFFALDEYRAYRASFEIVKGLVEDYGRMKLLDMLYALGAGRSFDQSLMDVYGITMDAFNPYMEH
jgi:hypothetical protein